MTKLSSRLSRAAIISVAAILAGTLGNLPAAAQTAATGALVGTITDGSGAAVPGATVAVTSGVTGARRVVQSDTSGVYRVPLLPPGPYRVEVSADGFKKAVRENALINVTETLTVNVELEVGELGQTVTVEASAEVVQSETATLGSLVSSRTITSLPLTTRNYTQVISLSGGVMGDVPNAGALGRNSQDVYVNGARNIDNNYQMDGSNINNLGTGRAGEFLAYTGIAVPNPDSIQEFKIQTSLYDAGYGRNAGANVNVVTKSGTNDFHGTLLWFFRDESLNANEFFLNRNKEPKPILSQNQFGGTLGGPVVRDKLFFFFSYQGTRQDNGIGPNALQSSFLPPLTDDRSAAALGAQFCGQTGRFGGEAVACDGSNINPVALTILNTKLEDGTFFIPTPQTIDSSGLGFSVFTIPAEFTENQYVGNVDYLISDKHTFSARYFYSKTPSIAFFTRGSTVPGAPASRDADNTNAVLKLISLPKNNLINEFRFSFARNFGKSTSLTPLTAADLGMVPSSTFPTMPTISVSGLFGLGGDFNDDFTTASNSFQVADQVSWVRGRHNIRAGFEFERGQFNFDLVGVSRGSLSFQSFPDFLLGMSAAQNGSPVSNVFSSFGIAGALDRKFRVNNYSAYVQDDIKVNPRLSLNLGLRWEILGLMSDADGRLINFWPSLVTGPPPSEGTFTGRIAVSNFPTGQFPLPPGIFVNGLTPARDDTPLRNFGPRISLAWQPFSGTDRFVVRSGYGVFYSRTSGQTVLRLVLSPPFVSSASLSGQANALATFQVPFNPPPTPGTIPMITPTSRLSESTVAEDFNAPMTQHWSLSLQYEFAPRFLLEVAYVGTRGTRLNQTRNVTQPALASPSNPVNGITTNTVANALDRIPVPFLGFSRIIQAETFGFSSHHSIQTTVRKHFGHGLQFQTSYTFGRSLTDVIGQGESASFQGGNGNFNDVNNRRKRWGPADFDRKHRLVISYFYEFPAFQTGAGFLGRLLTGWTLSGVTTFQSGQALTISDRRGGSIFAFNSSSGGTLCGGSSHSDIPTTGSVDSRLNGFFNSTVFCAPPALGDGTDFGLLGRGIVRGPDQRNFDIAVGKRTHVGGLSEDGFVEFRTEFFNAFNTPQFGNPVTEVTSPSFGRISSTTVAPRLIQFGLKYVF